MPRLLVNEHVAILATIHSRVQVITSEANALSDILIFGDLHTWVQHTGY